jgi:uncharacterized protein involved in type VI secretion and phage assembly
MSERRENGIVIGIVSDLNDPAGLGRVKVKYPYLDDKESDWAWLVTPMAGSDRGIFFRPEPNDQVLIGCELGDPRRPYVLGALWSSADKPPDIAQQNTKNNQRYMKSRSGHLIRFDDTPGQEKIEIIDKDGSHKVIIDSAHQKIQVICDTGDVEVSAKSGTVKIEALTVEVKATTSLTLESQGPLSIKGTTIDINSTGPMTVAGTPIKLN